MTFFKSKDPIRSLKVFLITVFIVVAGPALAAFTFHVWDEHRHPGQKVVAAQVITKQISAAIEQYAEEYGTPPAGNDAAIAAALVGQNPRKITFFEISSRYLTPKGKLIDPWNTPYHIQIRGREACVWSSGKDRIDHGGSPGSDDVVAQPFVQKSR